MGTHAAIAHDRFPKQGTALHRRFRICFHYDTGHQVMARCIRDDREEPGIMLFQLDDGRVVLATECQYQAADDGGAGAQP